MFQEFFSGIPSGVSKSLDQDLGSNCLQRFSSDNTGRQRVTELGSKMKLILYCYRSEQSCECG